MAAWTPLAVGVKSNLAISVLAPVATTLSEGIELQPPSGQQFADRSSRRSQRPRVLEPRFDRNETGLSILDLTRFLEMEWSPPRIASGAGFA